MPRTKRIYKRRNTRRTKRTYKRPAAKRNRYRNKIPRSVVPQFRFVALKYNDMEQLSKTGNYFDLIRMFQSSCNQPRLPAGAGHQMMWWDQLSYMYKNYRVYGIKYKFTITATTTDESYRVVVMNQSSSIAEINTTAGYLAAVERGHCKSRDGGSRNGSRGQTVVSGYMNVAQTLGVAKGTVNYDTDFQGLTNLTSTQFSGSNPFRMAYLGLYIHCFGGITLDYKTELTYYVKVFNSQEVPLS